jgi:hypothetical protein
MLLTQVVAAQFLRRVLPDALTGSGVNMLVVAGASLIGALAAAYVDRLVNGATGTILAASAGALCVAATLWVLDQRLRLGMWQTVQFVLGRSATPRPETL